MCAIWHADNRNLGTRSALSATRRRADNVASGLLDSLSPYCSLGMARIGISRLAWLRRYFGSLKHTEACPKTWRRHRSRPWRQGWPLWPAGGAVAWHSLGLHPARGQPALPLAGISRLCVPAVRMGLGTRRHGDDYSFANSSGEVLRRRLALAANQTRWSTMGCGLKSSTPSSPTKIQPMSYTWVTCATSKALMCC